MKNYYIVLSFILSILFSGIQSSAQVADSSNVINDNSPDSFISRINCNANNDLWSYFACEPKAIDPVDSQKFDSVYINIEIARLPYPFVTSHKLFIVSFHKAGIEWLRELNHTPVLGDTVISSISSESRLAVDDFISRFKN